METENQQKSKDNEEIGSQAKDLYGGIKSFNNQLIKI
jgi:hypothetical protein